MLPANLLHLSCPIFPCEGSGREVEPTPCPMPDCNHILEGQGASSMHLLYAHGWELFMQNEPLEDPDKPVCSPTHFTQPRSGPYSPITKVHRRRLPLPHILDKPHYCTSELSRPSASDAERWAGEHVTNARLEATRSATAEVSTYCQATQRWDVSALGPMCRPRTPLS